MPTQGNVWICDNILDVLPVRDASYNLTSGNIVIRCEALNSVLIEGNVIGFNGPSAWTPTWSNDAIDAPGCNWVNITNNQIQWATDGIGVNNAIDASVSGNIVYNCIGEAISSFASGGSGVSYFNVTGNIIIGVPPSAIVAAKGPMLFAIRATSAVSPLSQYVSIVGNICYGPFADGAIDGNAANATISDNQIDCQGTASGGPYPGVGITIKQNDCTVNGNTIRNQHGSASAAAIRMNASLSGLVIQGNNIDATNTTPIQFGGTFPSGSLISDNFGIVTYGTISQPSVPANSVTFANPFPFNCTVYLRSAGATIGSVVVDGITTGYSSTLNGVAVCPISVKCGGVITLNYSAGTPAWVWIPE
jgi:hypothetical protein